jgi:hypothetical protein
MPATNRADHVLITLTRPDAAKAAGRGCAMQAA